MIPPNHDQQPELAESGPATPLLSGLKTVPSEQVGYLLERYALFRRLQMELGEKALPGQSNVARRPGLGTGMKASARLHHRPDCTWYTATVRNLASIW